MANLNYWDGAAWRPIGTGGPAGPAGSDGVSVEVFGPQAPQPAPIRRGDVWLQEPSPAAAPVNLSPPAPARVVHVIGLAPVEPVRVVYLV